MAADLTNQEADSPRLHDLVTDNVVHSKFGSSRRNSFLPNDSFELLFTRDRIKKELSGASDELIDFVHAHATRTFATVLITFPPELKLDLTSIMESFRRYRFDDSFLPIDGEDLRSPSHRCEKHATALNVFRDDKVLSGSWNISKFLNFQWMFLVPTFPLPTNSRILNSSCVLPFTAFGECSFESNDSAMKFKAKLRVDHQTILSRENESLEMPVVLKVLRSPSGWTNPPDSERPGLESAWYKATAYGEYSGPDFPAEKSSDGAHEPRMIGSFSIDKEYWIITREK
ncbi:hypothetical protein F5Y14DRAFT_424119 [Nemania sp. NC0429]|nr:hypothetical protein F5Y14DRAFT_424119 [Nemania sp. NC0429]